MDACGPRRRLLVNSGSRSADAIIVAIAVDGVLNPFPRFATTRLADGYIEHPFAVPRSLVPARTRAWTTHDIAFRTTVALNPRHGQWINGLLETPGVQPVWASRWEHATTLLEPMLELSASLPVVEYSRHPGLAIWQRVNVNERQAKIAVLNELYPAQSIVWIDHVIPRSRVGHTRNGRNGRVGAWRCYQHVNAFAGLTVADTARADAFLASLAMVINLTGGPRPPDG